MKRQSIGKCLMPMVYMFAVIILVVGFTHIVIRCVIDAAIESMIERNLD